MCEAKALFTLVNKVVYGAYGIRTVLCYVHKHERLGRKEENRMDLIKEIEQGQLRTDLPELEIGSYVRVHVNIKEGNRERVQVFEGTIISKKGTSSRETVTVRRVSYGVGVERVFPIHSPIINKIEIVRKGKVRRAKLYYLRERVGKGAKVKEKI